jgi:hypothetical protein
VEAAAIGHGRRRNLFRQDPRQLSPAGIRLFELQLAALYRAQHAWPVQQLPPSQQSAERDVARAVPITAAIAAIKMRYFIIPPVEDSVIPRQNGEGQFSGDHRTWRRRRRAFQS